MFEHRDYPSAREHSDMPTATADASRRYLRPVQNKSQRRGGEDLDSASPIDGDIDSARHIDRLASGSRGGRGHFRVFFRFFTGFALFIFRTGLRLALICQVMPPTGMPS